MENLEAPDDKDVEHFVPSKKRPKVVRRQMHDPPFRARIKIKPEQTRRSQRIAESGAEVNYKNLDIGDLDTDSNDVEYYNRRTSSNIIKYLLPQRQADGRARSESDEKKQGQGVCHQCQQFTDQIKSVCRNKACVSINPQLCASCLSSCYEENLEDVLKDPEWFCPFCRGICSCTLCRRRSNTRILSRYLDYQQKIDAWNKDENKENAIPACSTENDGGAVEHQDWCDLSKNYVYYKNEHAEIANEVHEQQEVRLEQDAQNGNDDENSDVDVEGIEDDDQLPLLH